MAFNVEDPKSIQAFLDESNDRLAKNVAEVMIPALGIQLQAAIKTAVAGAGQDAQAAIQTLSDRLDKLEGTLGGLVDHIFDRLEGVQVTVGKKGA